MSAFGGLFKSKAMAAGEGSHGQADSADRAAGGPGGRGPGGSDDRSAAGGSSAVEAEELGPCLRVPAQPMPPVRMPRLPRNLQPSVSSSGGSLVVGSVSTPSRSPPGTPASLPPEPLFGREEDSRTGQALQSGGSGGAKQSSFLSSGSGALASDRQAALQQSGSSQAQAEEWEEREEGCKRPPFRVSMTGSRGSVVAPAPRVSRKPHVRDGG
jgi:hypothetical protein